MSAAARPVIRDAVASDAADLSLLLGQLGYPTPPEAVAARLAGLATAGATRVLVAAEGARVVGFLALSRLDVIPYAAPLGRITALCVAAGARGAGVGTALAERAAAIARDWGCGKLEVTSNRRRTGAHAFYSQRGFEDTHRCFTKPLASGPGGGDAGVPC